MQHRDVRLFQIAVAVAGLVPVCAGLAGVLFGPMLVGPKLAGPGMALNVQPSVVSLDSHFRYLSGLLLGIGLSFWSLVPDIVNQRRVFTMLTAVVFLGGIGRLIGLGQWGVPSSPMIFGLIMELVVTPALWLWQARVSRRWGTDR
jgi:hypothetical protein